MEGFTESLVEEVKPEWKVRITLLLDPNFDLCRLCRLSFNVSNQANFEQSGQADRSQSQMIIQHMIISIIKRECVTYTAHNRVT